MAQGVAYIKPPTSVADGAYLDLIPSGEAVIHNIYVPMGSAVEYYWSDGSNNIKFDSDTVGRDNQQYHCSSAGYIRVKNISGGAIYIGADGMGTG